MWGSLIEVSYQNEKSNSLHQRLHKGRASHQHTQHLHVNSNPCECMPSEASGIILTNPTAMLTVESLMLSASSSRTSCRLASASPPQYISEQAVHNPAFLTKLPNLERRASRCSTDIHPSGVALLLSHLQVHVGSRPTCIAEPTSFMHRNHSLVLSATLQNPSWFSQDSRTLAP
jgi:hypothetical protein